MSGPLATALILLGGFTLYATIHCLFNAYYRPQRRMHVYFALMCVFACFYIYFRLNNLQSQSVENFIAMQRLGFLAAQLLFLSQIGFIMEYAQWRPRWLIGALVISLLSMLSLNLFLPYDLANSTPPILQRFILPWGETVTDTRIHNKTLWWQLQWVIILGVFIYQFAAAFRLRNIGETQRGNALLWFGGIYCIAVLTNQLINFYIVDLTQVAEFGFIAMIILMSLHFNWEARDTRVRAESAEGRYQQLLLTLPYGVQEINRLGNITFSNPAHDRLFGYPTGQMLGMSIFELPSSEEESDRLRNYLTNVFIRHTAPETYYKQIKRQSGEILSIKIDWDYKYDEQGTVIGLISVLSDITQQQQALAALKESEEKFRQLAENIKQLFYIRDLASNRMLYVSPAYETIWGRSLKQIYDDPADFINSIHPDDKSKVLQLISQQNQYGQLFDAEYRILDSQGTLRWIHARSYPIRNAGGELERIAGIVEDITQRKQTEQHLQERTTELKVSRDFTEAIVDIVGAVVIVTNSKGVIVRFNHACEHVTGYTAEEALGRVFWDFLLLPGEREGIKNTFFQLTAGQFPSHYENYWLHKDGSKHLISWSNTCLTDETGVVEYVIGTGVDITEQRRAEAALRDSAEKYRTLMEYASDIILIADLEGRLIEGNSIALEVLGYSREELLRLRVSDIHPPDQLPRTLTDFQTLLDTGSIVTHDTALLSRDGHVIPVDINANIIYYQGRKVAVGFMRDIRARKQIEAQLRQAERSHREMLVREVHHRIKNNLQGVIGLLRNSLSDEDGISEQSERLVARAISQISTIAMVHGLQSHFSHGEVRICEITRAILDQSRSFAAGDIHIEFHENVTQPALLQEEEAIPLALVINELLTNAIKHIPASTKNKQVIVEIKGSPVEGMDLLVFNSGATLPQDLNTTDRNLSGVGLDLIQALLPKQYAHFSLSEDPVACGVYAKLRIEPGILSPVSESRTEAPQNDSLY